MLTKNRKSISAIYAKLIDIRRNEELRLDDLGEKISEQAQNEYAALQYELEQLDKIISDLNSLATDQ